MKIRGFSMLSATDILFTVIFPGLVAAIILLIGWRPWNKLATRAHWAAPLAVGSAFLFAFGWIEGRHQLLPPTSAIPWLFYVGVAFTALGLLDSLVRFPTSLRALAVFLLTAASAGVVLKFNFTNQTWDAIHGGIWLACFAAIALIWWASLETIAGNPGLLGPLAMMMVSGTSAIVVAAVVDQTTGQGLGAMAIAFTVCLPLVAWRQNASIARGSAMVLAGVGACSLAAAHFVSDLPMYYVIILGLAPLTLWIGRVLPKKIRPWQRLVIQLLLLLIPLAIAGGLAAAQFQREAAQNSIDPYSQ